MRGVVSGLYVVTTNVIGLGLGPTLVAGATDYVFADPKAVAYSLAMVSWVMGPLAAGLLLSGHRAYRERLRALRLRQSERVSGQPGSQPTRG